MRHHDWYDIATLGVISGTLFFVFTYTSITAYQAWIAKDTMRRQLRAYLSVTTSGPPGVFAGLKPGSPGHPNPLAVLFIKNSGQTPAYEVSSWIAIDVKEYPLKTPLPTAPITQKLARTIIAPGDATSLITKAGRPLVSDEESDIRQGKKAIYVCGEVKYRDAFGRRQFVRFRFFNQLWLERPTSFEADEEGNEAS